MAARACASIPRPGTLLGELHLPDNDADNDSQRSPEWGYIASADGLLFGTVADPDHVVTYRFVNSGDLKKQLTESTKFFVLDAKTGEPRWTYRAQHSIRHNAIAIGGGRVYLIDRPLALFDRRRGARPEEKPEGQVHETGVFEGLRRRDWRSRVGGDGRYLRHTTRCQRPAERASHELSADSIPARVGGPVAD